LTPVIQAFYRGGIVKDIPIAQGFHDMLSFGLIDALLGRRSRRF